MLTNVTISRQAESPVAKEWSGVAKKPKSFYYLLPGQGRGARKRFIRNLIAAIIVGIITCGLLAWVCYLIAT